MINQLILILKAAIPLLERTEEFSTVGESTKSDLLTIKEFILESIEKLDSMRF